jgi:hypothetical protein
MKTIRQELTRTRRRLFIAMLASYGFFSAGMIGGEYIKAFIGVGLLGFAAGTCCCLLLLFRLKCPSCGGNLGYALAWPMSFDLSISDRIKFCQFCGVNLDKGIIE